MNTSAMTPTDAASAAIPTPTRLQRFEQPLHYLFAPYFESPEAVGKKQIYDIPPTCPESRAPIPPQPRYIKNVANRNWMLNPRPPASHLPALSPHQRDNPQSAPWANSPTEYTPKNVHTAAPNTRSRGNDRNQDDTTIN